MSPAVRFCVAFVFLGAVLLGCGVWGVRRALESYTGRADGAISSTFVHLNSVCFYEYKFSAVDGVEYTGVYSSYCLSGQLALWVLPMTVFYDPMDPTHNVAFWQATIASEQWPMCVAFTGGAMLVMGLMAFLLLPRRNTQTRLSSSPLLDV